MFMCVCTCEEGLYKSVVCTGLCALGRGSVCRALCTQDHLRVRVLCCFGSFVCVLCIQGRSPCRGPVFECGICVGPVGLPLASVRGREAAGRRDTPQEVHSQRPGGLGPSFLPPFPGSSHSYLASRAGTGDRAGASTEPSECEHRPSPVQALPLTIASPSRMSPAYPKIMEGWDLSREPGEQKSTITIPDPTPHPWPASLRRPVCLRAAPIALA